MTDDNQSDLERAELAEVHAESERVWKKAADRERMNVILDARHAATYGAAFAGFHRKYAHSSTTEGFSKRAHDASMRIALKAREESKKQFEEFPDAVREYFNLKGD